MKTPSWIKRIKTPKVSKRNYTPIYAPILTGNEKKYVDQCLDEGWLSPKGTFVVKFEHDFARYCHVPYALSCSSGTAAIHLALIAAGIKKGDEVILPSFTMVSTAFAVSYTGAKPVFVDCQLETGNLDPDLINTNITPSTKALIPVDVYGLPANHQFMKQIAEKHHLVIIEDAAEAIGSIYNSKKIGAVNDITAFSLYINKIVTTGQGGMITTNSRKLYRKLKQLNNYYFSPVRHFWHRKIGYNFRLSNLQAAVGVAQLEHIEDTLKRKRQIALWYKELFSPIREYFFPLQTANGTQSNFWHIAYRLSHERFDVMKLRNLLGKNGIETRSFFIPLHLQPAYRKAEYVGKFPNSELLAKTGVLLPSGPTLNQSTIERICKVIINYFTGRRNY